MPASPSSCEDLDEASPATFSLSRILVTARHLQAIRYTAKPTRRPAAIMHSRLSLSSLQVVESHQVMSWVYSMKCDDRVPWEMNEGCSD